TSGTPQLKLRESRSSPPVPTRFIGSRSAPQISMGWIGIKPLIDAMDVNHDVLRQRPEPPDTVLDHLPLEVIRMGLPCRAIVARGDDREVECDGRARCDIIRHGDPTDAPSAIVLWILQAKRVEVWAGTCPVPVVTSPKFHV